MDRTISHLQLVSGGSKRISHGIALAMRRHQHCQQVQGRVRDTRNRSSGRILQHGIHMVLQGAHQEGSQTSGNRPVLEPVDSRSE